MSETCDCGRPALLRDHFCKECREEFDDYIFKEMIKEAIEERERLEQGVNSETLFNQLAPELRQAVLANGGGHRTIYPGEIFFPSKELAEEWAEEEEKGRGYIVGIIVVLALPDGQRIGLTTTA